MKNNYSIAERNRIVEEHLWCIDRVIRKNRSLMRAARLDYLRVICVERGQRTIMEAIQIWDTSYANVRKEIKSVVDRRLQQSVDSLWGIEALPFLKQYLLYPYAPEDLAEDLLKELANQSEAGGDTAGFVSTQEHFLAAPRNMRGLQDSSLIQNAQCDTKSRN